jgi:hypothetical protein
VDTFDDPDMFDSSDDDDLLRATRISRRRRRRRKIKAAEGKIKEMAQNVC